MERHEVGTYLSGIAHEVLFIQGLHALLNCTKMLKIKQCNTRYWIKSERNSPQIIAAGKGSHEEKQVI